MKCPGLTDRACGLLWRLSQTCCETLGKSLPFLGFSLPLAKQVLITFTIPREYTSYTERCVNVNRLLRTLFREWGTSLPCLRLFCAAFGLRDCCPASEIL